MILCSKTYDENIIIGHGCAVADIYDSSNLIGSTSNLESKEIPNPLQSGSYTAIFSEYSSSYSDSTGILYFKSSGFKITNLLLNSEIYLPYRTANIYRLNISEASSYAIHTNFASLDVYDSNLNMIGSTNNRSGVKLSNPLTLSSGEYYFMSYTSRCPKDGSFSITKI